MGWWCVVCATPRQMLASLQSGYDIVAAYPDTRYVVVGGGPQENELKKLAKELGIADHVTFVGHAPYDKLLTYLAAADFYVDPVNYPLPTGSTWWGHATVANWMDVPFNVVISNVPGPQFPIYGLGSRLVGNYPVSAINDGIGLNITVMSYNGNLDFGLVACRELMPDVWDLMDYLRESLAELREAAKAARDDRA